MISLAFRDRVKEGNKKIRPSMRDGFRFRDTTLIPGSITSPGSLQRTNIRVSYNVEKPSALNTYFSAPLPG